MTICIINDGQGRWAADLEDLQTVLERLGWSYDPWTSDWREPPEQKAPDEPSHYTDLCQDVAAMPMPADTQDCITMTWWPDRDAWHIAGDVI